MTYTHYPYGTGCEAAVAAAQHRLHWQHFYAGATDALAGCIDAPEVLPAGATWCGDWGDTPTGEIVARPYC